MAARVFWRRRVARILPIYLLAAVIGLILPGGWAPPNWTTWVTSLTLTQAWFPAPSIHFGGDGVAWSLSVEAFFYLLFPLAWTALVRVSPNARRAVGLGCAALVMLGGAAPDRWRWAVYVLPLARLPEFLLGIVAALAVRDGWRPRTWTALLALVPGVGVAYAVATPARYDYEFATIVCFGLLIPALAAKELRGHPGFLASRPMVALGSASYALYLFHQLVFRGFTVLVARINLALSTGTMLAALRHGLEVALGTNLLLAALAISLSLAVAEVAHERVEIPMQRFILRIGIPVIPRSGLRRASRPEGIVAQNKPGSLERDSPVAQ
jgi:peptidoglycan/LPS O-acetylase OafA/YrhL